MWKVQNTCRTVLQQISAYILRAFYRKKLPFYALIALLDEQQFWEMGKCDWEQQQRIQLLNKDQFAQNAQQVQSEILLCKSLYKIDGSFYSNLVIFDIRQNKVESYYA